MTGKELRAIRMRFGMSRKELAKAIGGNHKTICNWEIERCAIKPFAEKAIMDFIKTIEVKDGN